MACHPEQPFTAAQEQRIREIAREERASSAQTQDRRAERWRRAEQAGAVIDA